MKIIKSITAFLAIVLLFTFCAPATVNNQVDYTAALQEFRSLAEQGDAQAQYKLGTMYDNGQEVSQDYAEAAKWYRKAAEQGFAKAQFNLGWMYKNGRGVKKDYGYAYVWFDIAASLGDRNSIKERVIIARKIKQSQIVEAKRLAKECIANNYKDC